MIIAIVHQTIWSDKNGSPNNKKLFVKPSTRNKAILTNDSAYANLFFLYNRKMAETINKMATIAKHIPAVKTLLCETFAISTLAAPLKSAIQPTPLIIPKMSIKTAAVILKNLDFFIFIQF